MQLTVKDVAKLLNVAEKTVYRWIRSSDLPAYRVEGQYRINRSLLLEWATSHKINMSSNIFHEPDFAGPLPSLHDALKNGGINYRIEGKEKAGVLKEVVKVLRIPPNVDQDFLYQALCARENLQSTGIGDGIAVPHVRNPVILEVDQAMVCLCFLENPIEFGALDGKPVSVLFTLISPTVRVHLHLLSRISFALHDPAFKEVLRQQGTREELFRELQRIETPLPSASESAEGTAPSPA